MQSEIRLALPLPAHEPECGPSRPQRRSNFERSRYPCDLRDSHVAAPGTGALRFRGAKRDRGSGNSLLHPMEERVGERRRDCPSIFGLPLPMNWSAEHRLGPLQSTSTTPHRAEAVLGAPIANRFRGSLREFFRGILSSVLSPLLRRGERKKKRFANSLPGKQRLA